MAGSKWRYKIHPLSTTKNIVNKSTFWWLRNLLWDSTKHNLEESHFYDTLSYIQKEMLSDKLERTWFEEIKIDDGQMKKRSLWKVIVKVYSRRFIGYSTFYLLYYAIQILQPFLLNLMISYFHSSTSFTLEAFLLASTLVFFSIMETILKRQGHFQLSRVGLQIRVDCSSLMYKKLLRLSSTSKATESLINLMSNDVVKFENLCLYLPNMFTVPLQLVVMTYLVSCYVGATAAFCSILTLILLTLPGQAIFYKVMLKLRAKQTARTDKRISLIDEVINGIRTIKMYVWEHYFEKLINLARKQEINVFFQMSYATSLVASPMMFTHQICIVFVILTCTMPLSVSRIIPVMQLIWVLKENVNYHFFAAIKAIADTNVSIKRIQNFLHIEEVKPNKLKSCDDSVNGFIQLNAVTASWNSENPNPILKNISLKIDCGKLCAVIGPVGSGKSALLKLVLGELSSVTGELTINGKICYASQQPWLFKGSVRQNILFGEKYNGERYKAVVEACALTYDFHRLPSGDQTVVGERGASLSGGQCSRINLARAVYRDADIYLLDDPLSAVDSRVAEILFEKCIKTLLKNKTRIFVTNNTSFLEQTDSIIALNNGCIDHQGPFVKLRFSRHHSHKSLITDATSVHTNENANECIEFSSLMTSTEKNLNESDETEELVCKNKSNIPKSMYWRYFQASHSYFGLCSWALNGILVVLLLAGFDYWIVTWLQRQNFNNSITIHQSNHSSNKTHIEEASFLDNFSYISTILIAGTIVTSVLTNISLYNIALNSSKNLHKKIFSCLMKTPLRFFVVNPSGRILNRFAQDTGSADDLLASAIFDTSYCCVLTAANLIAIVVVMQWHLISIAAIAWFYYQVYKLFAPTIRNMKRLEGIAKSPVLSSVTSSFAGASTIRSYHAEELVTKDFLARQDRHTTARFLIIALSQAFSLWLDLVTTSLLAIVIYSCLVLKTTNVSAGYLGLSLLQVLNISTNISFAVKQFTETLAYMVNVERMVQFTELDPEESNPPVTLPVYWPSSGKLTFDHLYLRYSDDGEPVLKNLNFSVIPGTKVGVVGRTGAGKSSLISALFRLANLDGFLYIDDIDSKKIDLKTLRSKISVIPQEPVLFCGSLRSNLDPFDEFEDALLWSALEDVELKQSFSSLDCTIHQGGSNLSSGQKQLLCLARAIIRNNKILILDEATANVDSATDAFIQKTIRAKFGSCTVLTIAHKLTTVMDSDRILVLDSGRVIEYDHPYLLLQKTNGYFAPMVQRTGIAHSQHLVEIAENAYSINSPK